MSKEVAAAILTRVYYDNVLNAKDGLHAHETDIRAASVEAIGKVYAGFLQKLPQFEKWAGDKTVKFTG